MLFRVFFVVLFIAAITNTWLFMIGRLLPIGLGQHLAECWQVPPDSQIQGRPPLLPTFLPFLPAQCREGCGGADAFHSVTLTSYTACY